MGKQQLWENDVFYSGLCLSYLGTLLPHVYVSQMWGYHGTFFSTSIFISLRMGGQDRAMPSFSGSYLQECPIRIFFTVLEERSIYVNKYILFWGFFCGRLFSCDHSEVWEWSSQCSLPEVCFHNGICHTICTPSSWPVGA